MKLGHSRDAHFVQMRTITVIFYRLVKCKKNVKALKIDVKNALLRMLDLVMETSLNVSKAASYGMSGTRRGKGVKGGLCDGGPVAEKLSFCQFFLLNMLGDSDTQFFFL